jgi:hypothetical protein
MQKITFPLTHLLLTFYINTYDLCMALKNVLNKLCLYLLNVFHLENSTVFTLYYVYFIRNVCIFLFLVFSCLPVV